MTDEKCIHLPVPIGGEIFVPYRFEDVVEATEEGVEVFTLAGFYVLDGKKYYVVYNDVSKTTDDIPVENAYLTHEEAEERLKNDKGEI